MYVLFILFSAIEYAPKTPRGIHTPKTNPFNVVDTKMYTL